MPRIVQDCAFCGRQISIYVDEDGEILSDVYFMGVDPMGQERWACNECRRYAHSERRPAEPIRSLDNLETLPNPLDANFCLWLSGWTDARGHFGLGVRGNGYGWVYETLASADEKRTLEHIRQQLGFGCIVSKPSRVKPATGYRFVVQERDDIEVLMMIFEHFALQNPQRQSQFQVWCEAFDFDRKHENRDSAYLQTMRAYVRRLKKLKQRPSARKKPRHQGRDAKEPSLFDLR